MCGPAGGVDARLLERWAGGLSLAAGAVHGLVAPAHFEEWWGYGMFFVIATLAQAVYGLALLTGPVDRPLAAKERRALYGWGIVGNLAVVALFVVTRTTGIPFFGPEAGVVAEVRALDVVSKAAEIALVVVLARLLARTPRA